MLVGWLKCLIYLFFPLSFKNQTLEPVPPRQNEGSQSNHENLWIVHYFFVLWTCFICCFSFCSEQDNHVQKVVFFLSFFKSWNCILSLATRLRCFRIVYDVFVCLCFGVTFLLLLILINSRVIVWCRLRIESCLLYHNIIMWQNQNFYFPTMMYIMN